MLRWKAGTALFDVLSTVHLSLPAEIINLLLYQFENSSAELSVWSSPGSSTIARRRDNQEIHSSACAIVALHVNSEKALLYCTIATPATAANGV